MPAGVNFDLRSILDDQLSVRMQHSDSDTGESRVSSMVINLLNKEVLCMKILRMADQHKNELHTSYS